MVFHGVVMDALFPRETCCMCVLWQCWRNNEREFKLGAVARFACFPFSLCPVLLLLITLPWTQHKYLLLPRIQAISFLSQIRSCLTVYISSKRQARRFSEDHRLIDFFLP